MAIILLVEDDKALQELVSEFLAGHGYSVQIEGRGDQAVSRILTLKPDLVLLDLMLPGLDGIEVCRQARERGFAGAIVMLTARGDAIDEIMGLQVGADDYMTKPVRPRVLLAHVQAVLRRATAPARIIQRGRLSIDHTARAATLDGVELDLSTGEFELLVALAIRAGTVVSRDDLSIELRGFPWDGRDRSIDLRVSRLRKKLQDDGTALKSVRGSGYLLVPEV